MIPIRIAYHLPFVAITLRANSQNLQLSHVLIDTGSAASIFKTDDLIRIGIRLEPTDHVRSMTGIGGSELVVEKQIDAVEVGQISVSPFTIQMGALDYGMPLDGILGMDFLTHVGARIDLGKLDLSVSR